MRIYCSDGEENITIDGEGMLLTETLEIDARGVSIPVIVKNFNVYIDRDYNIPGIRMLGFVFDRETKNGTEYIYRP